RQETQIPQRRHRLSSLCLRNGKPKGRRCSWRFSRTQWGQYCRSAGRVLRARVLCRLFHRSGWHEIGSHDLGAGRDAKCHGASNEAQNETQSRCAERGKEEIEVLNLPLTQGGNHAGAAISKSLAIAYKRVTRD